MKRYSYFDLTKYNSYRLSAICKEAIFPECVQDIIDIYKEGSDDIILIGNGYNIILAEPYYDKRFMIFNGNYNEITVSSSEDTITAQAGCTMLRLSELALQFSYSGLEIFYDIPSSLGGAVVMNAGASGEEIRDLIVEVEYLDLTDMKIKLISKEDINFQYRNSFFQKNKDKIVLKTTMKLNKGSEKEIKSKMDRIRDQRWAKQPRDYPNAGSVFKRPPGYYVGKLTQDLGLKGYTVGGAMLSQKHGGFIVNHNGATGRDILDIIAHVKKVVFEAYGVNMEIEQRVI